MGYFDLRRHPGIANRRRSEIGSPGLNFKPFDMGWEATAGRRRSAESDGIHFAANEPRGQSLSPPPGVTFLFCV